MRTTFYLDYVGCKVGYLYQNRMYTDRFISTMWDVKTIRKHGAYMTPEVLSRLCGM